MVFQDALFIATVEIKTRFCYKKRFTVFPKSICWVGNGVCLEDHARNLIKLILKPKLSQFNALSVQKCVQRFLTGTCQITLRKIYNLSHHRLQAKTFYKQRSLIVNDSITAPFLFLLLNVNQSVSTENV